MQIAFTPGDFIGSCVKDVRQNNVMAITISIKDIPLSE
jgi:hypothetical protein